MAPLGRERGGGGTERVAAVSDSGGGRARGRPGARGARTRHGCGAGKERREGEERGAGWAPPGGERDGSGNGARPARPLVGRRLGLRFVSFLFFFSFLFKNINKYIFKNSKNHNIYTKIIYN
jgi:hypothetical protein